MNRFSLKLYAAGVFWVMAILGTATVILTLVMTLTNVSEAILPATGQLLRLAAVFIGSIVAAKHAGSKGLFYGAAIASTALVIFILLGRIWQMATIPWLSVVTIFLAGILGGMVGIGLSEQQ